MPSFACQAYLVLEDTSVRPPHAPLLLLPTTLEKQLQAKLLSNLSCNSMCLTAAREVPPGCVENRCCSCLQRSVLLAQTKQPGLLYVDAALTAVAGTENNLHLGRTVVAVLST